MYQDAQGEHTQAQRAVHCFCRRPHTLRASQGRTTAQVQHVIDVLNARKDGGAGPSSPAKLQTSSKRKRANT